MARPKKSEGTEVRHAMNGPEIEHDHLIGKIDKWNDEDRARASTAAETRGEIGAFTERTGMNPKALSMVRTIKKAAMKDGGQAKAMDIIRSLEAALPMVKADISGQQSDFDFEGGNVTEEEPVVPVEAEILSRPTYGDDGHIDDDEHGYRQGLKDDDDFDAHLAEVAAQ